MRILFCGLLTLATSILGSAQAAPKLTTIYDFKGGDYPRSPIGNLAVGPLGHIYGTAYLGSLNASVYELTPPASGQTSWKQTLLWVSLKNSNGGYVHGGVIRDRSGNLFGTTGNGAKNNCGTVFELPRTSTGYGYKELWKFRGGSTDGCESSAALVRDSNGSLYGTTIFGGPQNRGMVFKLTPPAPGSSLWTESIIWSFSETDGAYPHAPMVFDAHGNLYGTATNGGTNNDGTAWELSPPAPGQTNWSLNVLFDFGSTVASGTDGFSPGFGALVFDAKGNLYGTCGQGETNQVAGTVFMLSPPTNGSTGWTETTLWSFMKAGGNGPSTGVVFTNDGALVGATAPLRSKHNGSIYKLLPPPSGQTSWQLETLLKFDNTNGSNPETQPFVKPNGDIVGATVSGGADADGTVWELSTSQP